MWAKSGQLIMIASLHQFYMHHMKSLFPCFCRKTVNFSLMWCVKWMEIKDDYWLALFGSHFFNYGGIYFCYKCRGEIRSYLFLSLTHAYIWSIFYDIDLWYKCLVMCCIRLVMQNLITWRCNTGLHLVAASLCLWCSAYLHWTIHEAVHVRHGMLSLA